MPYRFLGKYKPEASLVVEDFQPAFDGCPVPNTLLAMENCASMMRQA
jgi:hypothetical protein